MIATLVEVVHKVGDGLLQFTRSLRRYLVHLLLDALIVRLWFSAGLKVIRRRRDETDPCQAQVIALDA